MLRLSTSLYGIHASDSDHGHDIPRKKDWGQKVKQFNLRNHLTSPAGMELKTGAENSRRLARNHMRLGIDEEHHRELVPENPPAGIVKRFDSTQEAPSKGPKLDMDTFADALPFGYGPGIQPGLPKGTRDFWLGTGAPTQMWEVSYHSFIVKISYEFRILNLFYLCGLYFCLCCYLIDYSRLWLAQLQMSRDSSLILSVAFLAAVMVPSWILSQALIHKSWRIHCMMLYFLLQ